MTIIRNDEIRQYGWRNLTEMLNNVRGPSSPVYGGNAFFGATNVITRRGKEMAGSIDSYKGRATFGKMLDNGMNIAQQR